MRHSMATNGHSDALRPRTFEEAAARIRRGRYPHPASETWMLRDSRGVSIAHVAADRHLDIGFFPLGSPLWAEADNDGVTLAHKAIRASTIESQTPPPDWPFWALSNNSGWTVAHDAASRGLLSNFPFTWSLWAAVGWTEQDPLTGESSVCRVIALQADSYRGFQTDFPPTWEGWSWLVEGHGTLAHLFARRRLLPAMPDDWAGWAWKDAADRTVEDLVADEALCVLKEIGGAVRQMLRKSLETSIKSTKDAATE